MPPSTSPRPAVSVLLATYNGAAYVEALLDSLLAQTLPARIIARDDGSADATPHLLARRDARVRILEDDRGNVGVRENFNLLAQAADTPYVAFADQDDLWEPRRLEAGMAVMAELEGRLGPGVPVLVHGDLAVCDAQGRTVAPSLWRFQGLDPAVQDFSRLLVQNNVTGCTVLCNRALLEAAFPVPPGAIMHDWWLALVAAMSGTIGVVPEALVRYRQHGANQIGAVRGNLAGLLRRWRKTDPRAALRATQAQARAFHDRYLGQGDPHGALPLAAAYAGIRSRSYPGRLLTLWRYGLWKQGLLRNLGLVRYI